MFICSIASRVATRVVMWCSRRLVARPASCFEIRATYAACAGCRAGQPAQARARVRFTSYTGHLRRVPRSTALQVQACGARASWCAIAHKHYVRRGAAVLRRRFCGNIPLARWGTATRRRSRCAMSCAMRTSQQRHQDKLHPFCQQQHSAAAGGSLCRASSRAPDGRLGRGAGLFGYRGVARGM